MAKLEKMYWNPEVAKTRLSIFYGQIEEIITPEEASLHESCISGVVVTGQEFNFLDDGRVVSGFNKVCVYPYSIVLKYGDKLKVGTLLRTLITTESGGVTENASQILEFTNLVNI